MSAKGMDVFSLCDRVVGECKQFATSFMPIRADNIRHPVDFIFAEDRYWPEPLLLYPPIALASVAHPVETWRA